MQGNISRRLALRRFRRSPKNVASQRRYLKSSGGRKTRRKIELRYAQANRDKRRAKRAVAHAVRRGRLPRAKNLPCFECIERDAQHYHHPSYEPEDRLKVIPLCSCCHHHLHFKDQTEAIERLGMLRGWVQRNVVSFERVPDRFGRAGFKGITVLRLSCGHLKSIRGSATIPNNARCVSCAL
jgi:hypothetical protein